MGQWPAGVSGRAGGLPQKAHFCFLREEWVRTDKPGARRAVKPLLEKLGCAVLETRVGSGGERQERGQSNGKRELSKYVQTGLADQSKGLHPKETPAGQGKPCQGSGPGVVWGFCSTGSQRFEPCCFGSCFGCLCVSTTPDKCPVTASWGKFR